MQCHNQCLSQMGGPEMCTLKDRCYFVLGVYICCRLLSDTSEMDLFDLLNIHVFVCLLEFNVSLSQ